MNIVVTDGATLNPGDLDWHPLHKLGNVSVYGHSRPEEVTGRCAGAEILVVNKTVLDKPALEVLPGLRFIAVSATGFNNIDIETCRQRGIAVSNVVNYGSDAVAQHAFALLLALTNRVETHHRLVNRGAWGESGAFSFWASPISELAGKTLGIIGFGNIGRAAARIAVGFGMEVVCYSASGASGDTAESVSLPELLRRADVVTLHTHLTEGNQNLVNAEFLNAMKPTAFLINTARGGLVDETALAAALREGRLAGAGLDVLCSEPPPDDHPLLNLPNCVVTPHNAWASVEARRRLLNGTIENIRAFLKGEPVNLVT